MGRSYNDLKMETMKEKMIKLNEEYEKTKLLREFEKWVSGVKKLFTDSISPAADGNWQKRIV